MTEQRQPREPDALILSTPEHLIAFGFGTGLARKAPGTFGTLVGLPFYFALHGLPLPAYVLACALLFVFGCWVCGRSAHLLQVHDHGGIVFDEIVGFCIAAAPLLAYPAVSPWWLLAVFALFRFFDVLKPWPIRYFDEKLHGGFGIMFDDALAGLASAALLWAGLALVS